MASDYDQRISYSEKITLNESIEIKLYTTEIFLIVKINIYLFFTRYIVFYTKKLKLILKQSGWLLKLDTLEIKLNKM